MAMEELMYYVWQHRLYPLGALKTIDGQHIEVLNPGIRNYDSGPDFTNAAVRINGQEWYGNVEMHVRASDWHRHHHDNDPAYHSIILHVVDVDDDTILRPDGSPIPQLSLPCSSILNKAYHRLTDAAPAELTCARGVASLPKIYVTDWITSLAYERIYEKVNRIEELLERCNGNWSHVAYITLARALGFGINSDPMERLAQSTPLPTILKHSDDLLAIEAILFGQASLIPAMGDDLYINHIRNEYAFYKTKFGLTTPPSPNWKFSLRPQSHPYRRIALLARLITSNPLLFSQIFTFTDLRQARSLFQVDLNGYWALHYNFKVRTAPHTARLSDTAADLLIINCVAPLIYAYATFHGLSDRAEKAIAMLQQIKGEKNRYTTLFSAIGLQSPDAFTSQAIIQLRRKYCEQRKCIYCRFGHRLLSSVALRK